MYTYICICYIYIYIYVYSIYLPFPFSPLLLGNPTICKPQRDAPVRRHRLNGYVDLRGPISFLAVSLALYVVRAAKWQGKTSFSFLMASG